MPTSRREFLRYGGAAAGAALTGCGSGNGPVGFEPAPVPPAEPAPLPEPPPEPPPAEPPPPEPEPEPPAEPPDLPAVASLKSYLREHATTDLLLPAPPGTVPTIGWAGPLSTLPLAPTTLSGGVVVPVTSALVQRPLAHAWASAGSALQTDGYACHWPERAYTCKDAPRTVGSAVTFRFRTDAPVVELAGIFPDGSRSVQTLIVDGRLVPPKALSVSVGRGGLVAGAIRVDFGSRALRDIWWETSINAAYLRVGAADVVVPFDTEADPQITVVGDSFLQGVSSHFGNVGGIALGIAARLGLRRTCVDTVGGTGYWNSGGNLGNLLDRLPGHERDRSAIYVVLAGLNDYGDMVGNGVLVVPPTATYEAAVRAYLQGLRAARPEALIVVVSPLCPNPPMSDAFYGAVTLPSGQQLGGFLYKAFVHETAVAAIAGPWVYVDALMGGGWRNSSGASGDVTNLQWFTGGTPGLGTTPDFRPGNTQGGAGGGFGGIAAVPVQAGGLYSQAPEIVATGGTGAGLLLCSHLDGAGRLAGIVVLSPGEGYVALDGLPTIAIDRTFEISPAVLGSPVPMVPVNPDGQYPLPSFAPPGAADLNNAPRMLLPDLVHPSPTGVEYLAQRLARNIYDAVMAL